MRNRYLLVSLAVSVALACASPRPEPVRPAHIAVTVSGVPDGYTVMARWLGEPLFRTTIVAPSPGAPATLSAEAPAGAGNLQLWAIRNTSGGGTYCQKRVALNASSDYNLLVSLNDADDRLEFTLQPHPAQSAP